MKPISNLKQLKAEKARIQAERAHLEYKMAHQWNELKIHMRPAHLIKDMANQWVLKLTEEKLESDGSLKNTLLYGLGMLTKRFTEKISDKLSVWFDKK